MRGWIIMFAALVLLCLYKPGVAQTNDANYIDGQLFIKVKDSISDTLTLKSSFLLPLVEEYNLTACYRPFAGLNNDTLDRIYKVKFSDIQHTRQCMAALDSLSTLDYVERVPLYRTLFTPNDPDSNGQYFLKKINARDAWNISQGSPNVVVAIVDNSVLSTHQDLIANLVPGYDVADNDNNTDPPAAGAQNSYAWSHGTHCAGDASAVTNNGIGVSGIGFNTKILPVKCTPDSSQNGDDIDNGDEGIAYAMSHGANVISLSWGGYGYALTEQVLIDAAIDRNIVVIAAAGNDTAPKVLSPSAYRGVICVGATDSLDKITSYSNYGSRIDVMAPGDVIFSTYATSDSSYHEFSGTSMATPITAGLCALILALNPGYSPAQVLAAIKAGCDDISAENPAFIGQLGAGRINAFRALGGVETSVPELGDAGDIKVYPNPFTAYLNLRFDESLLPAQVLISDIEGRIVLNEGLSEGFNSVIDTYNLQSGMYIVKVITNSGSTSCRIVKI